MNVYDFDKTLFYPDSAFLFARYIMRKKPYLFFSYGFKILFTWILYFFKFKDRPSLDYVVNSTIKYLKKPNIEINNFWDKYEYKISSWYLKLKKSDDLIVSASPDYLLEEIARRLGVTLVASKVDKKTGKPSEPILYGVEKVNAIKKLNIKEIDNFYSDSFSDSLLASMAKKAYLVVDKGQRIIDWPELKN